MANSSTNSNNLSSNMAKYSKYSWLFAFLSALVAVALHSYLSTKFYALRFGALGESSLCNLNDLWNCDAVSASSYAQFLGTPMAVWGLATNLVFAGLLLIGRLGWFENEERGRRYIFWFALFIFAASIVMGAISLFKLRNLCLFCVMAYVLSIISLVGTYVWARPQWIPNLGSDLTALLTESKAVLIAFIAVPAIAFFAASAMVDSYNMGKMGLIVEEKISQWKTAKTYNFAKDKGLVLYHGTGEPKVEIVEFADFRCPHCKEAFMGLDAFATSHPDTKLIFKFYPLDGTCNPDPHMSGRGDGIGCEAAFVTYCSEKLFKKGWQSHHHLFEQQDTLRTLSKREEVQDFVCKALGMDCAAIKSCTESPETRAEIQATANEGVAADVQGTPTVYVNGRPLIYGQFLPVLEKAYDSLHSN